MTEYEFVLDEIPARKLKSIKNIINGLILNAYGGDYILFLKTIANVCIEADKGTEEILYPAWKKLIEKYNLTLIARPKEIVDDKK